MMIVNGMGMGRHGGQLRENADYDPKKKREKDKDKASLKWIIKVAKPQFPTIVAIVVCEAVWAVFGTITALFSKEIINSAVDGNKDRMFLFVGIYLVVALLLTAVHAFMRYITESCKAKLEMLFRNRTFGLMLRKSYPKLSEYHTGELVNRLTGDIGVISDAATTIIPNFVMISVRLVCAMAVLIAIEWRSAIVFGVGGIFILFFSRVFKGKIQKYHKEMQKADGKSRSFWQEIFENLVVVKSFSGEKKSVDKSQKLMQEHYKVRMKRSLVGSLSMLGVASVVRMGHLFAVGYGAFCMLNGTMDYGTLTALIQLVGQVQQPFSQMSGIMPRYYSALSSAERLMEVEELANDSIEGPLADAKELYKNMERIVVRGLDFSYDGENDVLVDCNISINKGDYISITGMSGIGKSTLFKVLLDIYPKNSGKAVFVTSEEEVPVNGLTRTMFAYVPQGNMLFSGTIRENLMFMANENTSEAEIKEALECACADKFLEDMPDGIDTLIGENGVGLSEGQIQRISVARAILSASPILLLDEATSALDDVTEAKMLENIKARTDKSCIIVTHRKAALEICNRHFVIENKKISEK